MAQPQLEKSSQELQAKFEELLESRNVYYNPPASVRMSYPAIVFKRSRINVLHANNAAYRRFCPYEVTVITRDPDSTIIEKILELPMCSFDRSFVTDNLYHNIFTIYN